MAESSTQHRGRGRGLGRAEEARVQFGAMLSDEERALLTATVQEVETLMMMRPADDARAQVT